jgi:hypothetical protein
MKRTGSNIYEKRTGESEQKEGEASLDYHSFREIEERSDTVRLTRKRPVRIICHHNIDNSGS